MAESGYIIARDLQVESACHWTIAALNISYNDRIYGGAAESSNNHSLLLRIEHLKTSCFDSYLQIYDGVPPNPRTQLVIASSPFKLLATLCGPDAMNHIYFRSTTGVFTLVYQGNVIKNLGERVLNANEQGFIGEYVALKCPASCPAPFRCNNAGSCECPADKTGAMCEYEACPDACSASINQGKCDQVLLPTSL